MCVGRKGYSTVWHWAKVTLRPDQTKEVKSKNVEIHSCSKRTRSQLVRESKRQRMCLDESMWLTLHGNYTKKKSNDRHDLLRVQKGNLVLSSFSSLARNNDRKDIRKDWRDGPQWDIFYSDLCVSPSICTILHLNKTVAAIHGCIEPRRQQLQGQVQSHLWQS